MSTILYNAPTHAWLASTAAESLWGRDLDGIAATGAAVADADHSVETGETDHAVRSAVLTLTGVPRYMRMHIERALVVCLRSQPAEPATSTPELEATFGDWFMRWSRDRSVRGTYAVRCRQILTATESEFTALSRVLEGLAAEHDFYAAVRLVD